MKSTEWRDYYFPYISVLPLSLSSISSPNQHQNTSLSSQRAILPEFGPATHNACEHVDATFIRT